MGHKDVCRNSNPWWWEGSWSCPRPWTSVRSWGVRGHRSVLLLQSEPLQPHSGHFERRKTSLLFTVCGCWWGQAHGVDVPKAPPVSLPSPVPLTWAVHLPLCRCVPRNILHWSCMFPRRKKAPYHPVLGKTPSPNANPVPRFAGCCWC